MLMNDTPKLLVVDDEPDNFEVVEILLFREGYDLVFAQSGREALQEIERQLPDTILLDAMMPEFDGFEVCRYIRSHSQYQHVPILMVTALDSKLDLAKGIEAGANDFISKPVNAVELRARVRSLLRVKQQYDQLKALLKTREELSNALVHDFRNPLSSIVMSADMLATTPLDTKQRKYVKYISSSGLRLQSMVDSLLIVAKVYANKLQLHYQPVDFVSLVRTTLSEFETLAERKQIQLVARFPDVRHTIDADETICRRVLDNLLANALKFSPKGSTVEIAIEYGDEGDLCVRVADDGPGVKPEVRQQIFEPFEIGQIMQGVSQTGLGLAFCKTAIEAHSGSISVENRTPHGAIFTLILPRKRCDGMTG